MGKRKKERKEEWAMKKKMTSLRRLKEKKKLKERK